MDRVLIPPDGDSQSQFGVFFFIKKSNDVYKWVKVECIRFLPCSMLVGRPRFFYFVATCIIYFMFNVYVMRMCLHCMRLVRDLNL